MFDLNRDGLHGPKSVLTDRKPGTSLGEVGDERLYAGNEGERRKVGKGKVLREGLFSRS